MAEFSSPILGMRVRRNVIPSAAVIGRPVQQAPQQDPQTAIALQRNQLALQSMNNTLAGVTTQIGVLSASLQGISQQIQRSSLIEQARDQQKNRQERTLAEQQIREGKESLIERRIQSALIKPLRVVGAKVQGSLFNLGKFFNTLLGGILVSRIISVISSLSSDGKEGLGQVFDKIKGDLAIAALLYGGLNGGFGILLNILGRLGSTIAAPALRLLLLRPIQFAFQLARAVAVATLAGLRGVPAVPPGGAPAPPTQQTPRSQPGNRNTQPPGLVRPGRRYGAGLSTAALNALFGIIQNRPIGEIGTSSTLSALPLIIGGANPFTFGLSLAGAFFGPQVFQGTGLSEIPELQQRPSDILDLFQGRTKKESDLQQDSNRVNNNTVIIPGQGGANAPIETESASGVGNYAPPVGSSNPSNPYVLYSAIQYNIGGVGL